MTLNFLRSDKWIAVAAVAMVITVRVSPIGALISLDTLRVYRDNLTVWVAANTVLASTGYVAIYIATTALSLPGAALLSLTGGFLFGAVFGTMLISVGATTGATFVFLFARTLFDDHALAKVSDQYPQLVAGIRRNDWSYLLVTRFIPLFPFFLVDLAAAVVGVRLLTYLGLETLSIAARNSRSGRCLRRRSSPHVWDFPSYPSSRSPLARALKEKSVKG